MTYTTSIRPIRPSQSLDHPDPELEIRTRNTKPTYSSHSSYHTLMACHSLAFTVSDREKDRGGKNTRPCHGVGKKLVREGNSNIRTRDDNVVKINIQTWFLGPKSLGGEECNRISRVSISPAPSPFISLSLFSFFLLLLRRLSISNSDCQTLLRARV